MGLKEDRAKNAVSGLTPMAPRSISCTNKEDVNQKVRKCPLLLHYKNPQMRSPYCTTWIGLGMLESWPTASLLHLAWRKRQAVLHVTPNWLPTSQPTLK